MRSDELERSNVKVTNIWAQITRKRWEIRCWLQLMTFRKPTLRYRMRPSPTTSDDPESSKVKVTNIWAQITRKRWDIRCWLKLMTYRKPTPGYRVSPSLMTLDDPERSEVKLTNIWWPIGKWPRSIEREYGRWPCMTAKVQRSRSRIFELE